ncbi:hypothetical protein IMSAGC013_02412 [Lachnospiraceae bacterium]|nr:hypothetical protein IMSAGC013_02412 [Lachnospiraceae bacterium]
MEIRPLTQAEQKYAYEQSMQIRGQTGSIGVMHGGYKSDREFYSRFYDLNERWKTGEFEEGLQNFLNIVSSDKDGFMRNLDTMREYTSCHPQNAFPAKEGTEYGFRADTEKYAYVMRCNPVKENDNVEIHCYVKEWLDKHISNAEKGIRFINSRYDELFRIEDGEKIVITDIGGEKSEYVCRYIDEYHTEVGNHLYHICQFAEIMERNGSEYAPVEPEPVQTEEKEQGQEEKTEGTLELKTQFGTTENVTLTVNTYVDNNSLYVGMTTAGDGFPEPYCDITVNLLTSVPPYCAFVDTNNMPELEDFLVKNGIAEFTGLMQQSGYCIYPLYLFDAEKMRGLCPDGMAAYEQENGLDKKQGKKEKSR